MIGYLDMPSGISGDMFLGCLVDAGWPVSALTMLLQRLDVPEDRWTIQAEKVTRGALAATLVHVHVEEETRHRHLPDVVEIIRSAGLPEVVEVNAIAVFQHLAKAEAAVHGTDVNDVHFHEVGALDAIIDIVGVCLGLHDLDITQLYAGSLPLGEGWTQSAHGMIPLPAPATLALLADAGAPTRRAPGPGELVTPTGAALVGTLAHFEQPSMALRRIGCGSGRKEFEWPNIARLWLGILQDQTATRSGSDTPYRHSDLVELETNIDDMSPELYAPVRQQLFTRGALDVWMTPIQMKKGRPATLLGVLARPDAVETLIDTLLRETTTLGVRTRIVRRYEAERETRTVETAFGSIRVKIKLVDGRAIDGKAEYDDCVRCAKDRQVPLRAVYGEVQRAIHEEISRFN